MVEKTRRANCDSPAPKAISLTAQNSAHAFQLQLVYLARRGLSPSIAGAVAPLVFGQARR